MRTFAVAFVAFAVGALIMWASFVHVFAHAEPGCWNEVNASQPMGIEKVCDHA